MLIDWFLPSLTATELASGAGPVQFRTDTIGRSPPVGHRERNEVSEPSTIVTLISTAFAPAGTSPANENVSVALGPSVEIGPASRVSSARSGTVGTSTVPVSDPPACTTNADPATNARPATADQTVAFPDFFI